MKLHLRAADWYESNGSPAMAVEHLLNTTERDRCVQLVTQLVLPTYQAGQMSTVQRWLSALGDSAIEDYPPLAVLAGWITALTGQTAEAQRWAAILDAASFDLVPAGRHGVVRLGAGDVAGRHVCRRSGTSDDRRELRRRPGAAVERMARQALCLCGEAHLLTGDVDRAAALFAESSTLAAAAGQHRFARSQRVRARIVGDGSRAMGGGGRARGTGTRRHR